MNWFQSVKNGIVRGRNAIVCTGAVTDGFPGMDLSDIYHPDQLLSWQQYIQEGVSFLRDGIPIVQGWTFDPAFGFRFHNEESNQAFLSLMTDEDPARPADAIDAARQTVRANALPMDPDSALRLMRRVCDKMKKKDFEHSTIRCLIVLPNLDTWCGPARAGVSNTNTTALLLEHLLTHQAYKSNRIIFVLSTTVMEGLHERLRNKHLPLYRVHIPVPDEETRRLFLAGLCNHEQREVRDLIAKHRQDLQKMLVHVQDDCAVKHRQAKALLKEVEERIRMKAITNRSVKRATADLSAAEQARAGLNDSRERDVRLKQLDDLIPGMKTRLDRRLVHVIPENVQTIVRSLAKGDVFFVKNGRDGMMVVDRVLADSNFISVSFTLSPASIGHPITTQDGKLQSFRFSIERIAGKPRLAMEKKSATGNWSAYYPFDGMNYEVFPLYAPKAEVEHFLRLDELERERTNLDDMHTLRLNQVEENVKQAERVLESVLIREFSTENDARLHYKSELEQCVHYSRNPEHHPESKRIAALIQAEQEQLKKILDLGFCPTPEQGTISAAADLQGLGYRQICTLLTDSRASRVPITRKEILATRIELLRQSYGHLFEIVEPTYGFEGIGGLDILKTFFAEMRDAVLRKEYRVVPMGTLLAGPPGTGKTGLAEAFARECGFLFVKIKNTKAMWVGESERIAAEMFAALRDLAPIVVLRDEVDQQDGKRGGFEGDSGVTANLRASWMQFLSDPTIRGRVIVVSCTNRTDLMDAAFLRSGRSDEIIPVLMPDEKTRTSVFEVMVKRSDFPCDIESFVPFAKMTPNRSGADIEVIVRRAFQHAIAEGKEQITSESLTWAIEDFSSHVAIEDIARMTLSALQSTSSKRFLPSNWQEIEKSCMEILQKQTSTPVIILEAIPIEKEEPHDPEAN